METSKTVCTAEVDQGTHVFDILGYSKHRGMGNDEGSYIRSGIFTVGGHDWAIRFYPDGHGKADEEYISVYLELLSQSYVRASCDLRLVDQRTGSPFSVHKTGPRVFSSIIVDPNASFAPQVPAFKTRSEVENSAFLKDDRLTIECIVTVVQMHQTEACKSRTASTCTPVVAQGTHVFDIFGYSKHIGMGSDDGSSHVYIRSRIFTVGGYDWVICFYPDGCGKESNEYISVYLELFSRNSTLRASCDLRLVDQYTGISSSVHKIEPRIFISNDNSTAFAPQTPLFKRRSEIEESAYLRDDRLTIECVVTVMEKPHVTETRSFPKIDMPPSDMAEHVGRLLGEKEGLDVSFVVGGETVQAHRLVLAMRSPVFKAELYGPMREARTGQSITVKDMEPAVFSALLHFIYTDSLPQKHLEGDDNIEMIRLLLVAADRYAIERLKVVCQCILCEDLNAETVATTLSLADQHNCGMLKDACLEFIEMSNSMDVVVATQGFKDLKRTCPSLIVEALEKRRKFHKA